MRIALSGSRVFDNRELVVRTLDAAVLRFAREGDPLEVSVGDARGLDALVWEWVAHPLNVGAGLLEAVQHVCTWPAGPGVTKQQRWYAAHERNMRVVSGADMLLAFYQDTPEAPRRESPGTTDAIRCAKEDGVLIVRVWRSWTRSWQTVTGAEALRGITAGG